MDMEACAVIDLGLRRSHDETTGSLTGPLADARRIIAAGERKAPAMRLPYSIAVVDVFQPAPTRNSAMVSDEMSIAELESRLRDLGYYDGPVESEPWPRTLLALKEFQHNQGLSETGRVDPATARALREAYCY